MRKGYYNADVVQLKLLCTDACSSCTGHGVPQHSMTAAYVILDRVILPYVEIKSNNKFKGFPLKGKLSENSNLLSGCGG
jgi:hypothetical protein